MRTSDIPVPASPLPSPSASASASSSSLPAASTPPPPCPTTDSRFEDLGISPITLKALIRLDYVKPSPVQVALIPPAIAGRDCIGNAPTGTGKTAAFLVPALDKMDEHKRHPTVLVLAPTRELVAQIGREFERLAYGRNCRAVGVVGGEPISRQHHLLARGCSMVIATPGRLLDLMQRRAVRLDQVTTVVLDEADQMLDIGFRPAVESILEAVPKPRQTLLLSATMPPAVRTLARTWLTDPVDVRLISEDEDATIPNIRQMYVMVTPERKVEALRRLLQREAPRRAIVFCRTRRGAERLGITLRQEGFQAAAMHGDLSQPQRNRVLHGFRNGRLSILVATDVVGRGIDVRGVSHVINFDLPEDPSYYVHRVGRTGRMGSDGLAFSFVPPEQSLMLDGIERAIARNLEHDHIEGMESPDRLRPRPQNNGPRRKGRPFQRPSMGGPPPRRTFPHPGARTRAVDHHHGMHPPRSQAHNHGSDHRPVT